MRTLIRASQTLKANISILKLSFIKGATLGFPTLLLILSSHDANACYYDFTSFISSNCSSTYTFTQCSVDGVRYYGCKNTTCSISSVPGQPGNTCVCMPGGATTGNNYLVCPGGAQPPAPPVANGPPRDKGNKCGSVIVVDSQVLQEKIPVVGTPFQLVYSSERVAGNTSSYSTSIPVTSSTFTSHSSIVSEVVSIQISGQTITQTYVPPLTANIVFNYTWDGKDQNGAPVAGSQIADVSVVENFNPAPTYNSGIYSKPALGHVTIESVGLGGWDLSAHHQYDPVKKLVLQGNGAQYPADYKSIAAGNFMVVSDDASEVFIFNSAWKHIETKTGLIGSTKYLFAYNGSWNLSSVTDAYGNQTVVNYTSGIISGITAPFGQVTQISTDSNGYITAVTNPASESHLISYYGGGLLETFEKPSGVVSTMLYDGAGRLIEDSSSAGSLTTLARATSGAAVTITSSSALGRSEVHTFPSTATEGKRTDVKAAGNTVSVTENVANFNRSYNDGIGTNTSQAFVNNIRFGSLHKYRSAFTLNRASSSRQLYSQQTVSPSSPSDPFVITSLTTTDTLNGKNTVSVYTASTKTNLTTSPVGRTSKIIVDSKERPTSIQLATFTPITFTYDTSGRLSQTSQGTNRISTNTYDTGTGYLASSTDYLNRTTSYTYDLAGRVLTQTLPDTRVITYTYDTQGNLSSVTPPGRPAHAMAYNGFDLLGSYTAPTTPSPVTSYTYNNDRQLTQITRPNGAVITSGYHATKGYLQSVATPLGTNTYAYATNGLLNYKYSYDGVNRSVRQNGGFLQSETTYVPGGTLGSTSFGYNTGHLISYEMLGTPSTSTVSIPFTYDNDDLLVTAGDETLTRSASTWLVSQAAIGANMKQLFSYSSSFGELSQIQAKYGSSVLYQEDLTRNNGGLVSGRTEAYGSSSSIYEYIYDAVGRLSDVKLGGTVVSHYDYDDNSNRTSQTIGSVTTTATYNDRDELLTFGTKTFTYNVNGEMTGFTDSSTSQTTAYAYDSFGNLKSVTTPSSTVVTYLLDADGRRVVKKIGSTVQMYYMHGRNGELVATVNPNKTLNARFVYGMRKHVPDYMIKGTVKYQIVTDHLGSPVQVIDTATGTIAQEIHYDEWGAITSDTNPGFQPFGFAGCHYDVDTKLCNFRTREYDASIGRWLTKDPVLFGGRDSNLYGYVLQDPINFIDPSGLVTSNEVVIGAATGALAGAAIGFGGPFAIGGILTNFGATGIGATVAGWAGVGGVAGGVLGALGGATGAAFGSDAVPGVPGTGSASSTADGGVPGIAGTGGADMCR